MNDEQLARRREQVERIADQFAERYWPALMALAEEPSSQQFLDDIEEAFAQEARGEPFMSLEEYMAKHRDRHPAPHQQHDPARTHLVRDPFGQNIEDTEAGA